MTYAKVAAGAILVGIASLAPIAAAQDPAISLVLSDEDGDIRLHVGDSMTRDRTTGTTRLTGGVQIERDDGSFILADEATLQNAAGSLSGPSSNALDGAILQGRVYMYGAEGVEVQAESLVLQDNLSRFEVVGTPVLVAFDGQRLQAEGGMRGDLDARVFYGFGGATFVLNEGRIFGEQVQVTLPEEDTGRVRLLAAGNIEFVGETTRATCEQIISSPDGEQLVLRGGVEIRGPDGTFKSGAATFDLTNDTFALEPDAAIPTQALEFFSL